MAGLLSNVYLYADTIHPAIRHVTLMILFYQLYNTHISIAQYYDT